MEYLREYRTYAHIAASYGVHEGQIVRYVRWVETTLIKEGTFRLPGKKELLKPDAQYEIVLVDATEFPIERPKRGQKFYYSGKKKRHTTKSQIVVNKYDKTIICTAFSNGKCHDFRLFKESKVFINKNIKLLADTGFQGITYIHGNSQTPEKNSKNSPLTKTQKLNNRKISILRIYVEHSISFIKRFKILSERYRNRRKRFSLRFNLISSFCNYDLLL